MTKVILPFLAMQTCCFCVSVKHIALHLAAHACTHMHAHTQTHALLHTHTPYTVLTSLPDSSRDSRQKWGAAHLTDGALDAWTSVRTGD